jgi:hypothetical protein
MGLSPGPDIGFIDYYEWIKYPFFQGGNFSFDTLYQ